MRQLAVLSDDLIDYIGMLVVSMPPGLGLRYFDGAFDTLSASRRRFNGLSVSAG